MKRCQFLFCCAAAVVVAGCSSENTSSTEEPRTVTLFADAEQPVARTRLALTAGEGDGVFDLTWSAGDAIAVIGAEGGTPHTSKFTLASGSGTTKGSFSGTLSASGEAPYYAVFPYREDATLDGEYLSFPVSQRVPGRVDNMASTALPAVARVAVEGEQASVAMHNVFGLLKLTFTSASAVTVKRITLRDLGGNMLWGTCRVPIVAGEPDYASATLSGGTNSVDLTWLSSVTFNSTAKSIYFPVPPGSLDRGFALVLYERDLTQPDSVGKAWTFLQKISSPVAAGRSTIVEIDAAALSEKSEPLEVKARGFYKSLFVDGGMFLTSNDSTINLPAIDFLDLENDYEYFGSSVNDDLTPASDSMQNLTIQNGIMVSAPAATTIIWNDANGVLVYPDGSPRFRMMYVNGGSSKNHGPTLGAEGRARIHDYYTNGGSYVGTCAGAIIASTYIDGNSESDNFYNNSDPSKNYSFGIWPGRVTHTSLPPSISTYPTVYTCQKVLPDMGALGPVYYGFATADTLEDTRHHGGCYLPHTEKNAGIIREELLSFQYCKNSGVPEASRYTESNAASMPKFQKKNGDPVRIVDSVSTWAYKASSASGRAVLCGSHPEGKNCNTGKQLNLMSFMLRYAMDGNGSPVVKTGDLALGYTRAMNLSTSDADPAHTKIGDRQYHHFRFEAASDIENFVLTLDSEFGPASGVNLYLALRRGGLAWISDADYVLCNRGGQKSISVKNLPAGTWYVSVYCATTVTATPTEIPTTSSKIAYWCYSGHTEVLDGIAYTIKIGEQKAGGLSPYLGTSLGSDSFDD